MLGVYEKTAAGWVADAHTLGGRAWDQLTRTRKAMESGSGHGGRGASEKEVV